MKTRRARSVGALAVLLFPLLANAQFTITPIVTTSTPVPGGAGPFKAFSAQNGTDPIAPSLDGTSMVFTAIDSNNRGGVYRWDNGVLSLVANQDTSVPNQSATFTLLSFAAISGQQVVFRASTPNGSGLYLANAGQILTIADTSSLSGVFARPAIADGQIAVTTDSGISRYRNGMLEPISGDYQSVGTAHIGRGGNIAFAAHLFDSTSGIYLADSANVVSKIADTNTPFADFPGSFTYFNVISTSVDGADVAFGGGNATKAGIWARLNGTLRPIALKGEIAASGQTLSFGPGFEARFSLDNQHLAFLDQSRTIYTDYRGQLERVIGLGDILSSKQIDRIEMSPDALSGSLLVFNAHFTDDSTGIYMTRVPEPVSAASLLALAALITIPWRRHRFDCRALVAPISTASKPF